MASLEAQLREAEARLLLPEVRSSAAALDVVIAPDFVEFGSSGAVYDRRAVVLAMLKEPQPKIPTLTEFRVRALSADVALVTYRTSGSVRSSIWRRENEAWRIVFHQGTPASNPQT
jgi:hypothetical protein